MPSSLVRRFDVVLTGALCVLGLTAADVRAADHIDMPRNVAGAMVVRPDASLTDFFTFVQGNKLVLALNINPGLSPDVDVYRFPTDVTYRFNVDTNPSVTIGTDVISREFGGVIAQPQNIVEDVVFEVKFDANNKPQLNVTGANPTRCQGIRSRTRIFTGLRAEAFIFAPAVRNNIGSIVIEVPLSAVLQGQSKLLTWATTTVDLPGGPFTEHMGRALRSQFPVHQGLNALHPNMHVANGFVRPDVTVIDVSKPTVFPNGRHPSDDVVSIVETFTSLPTDQNTANNERLFCAEGGRNFPCPVPVSATAEDIRLLGRFPYLGRPYRPEDMSCD